MARLNKRLAQLKQARMSRKLDLERVTGKSKTLVDLDKSSTSTTSSRSISSSTPSPTRSRSDSSSGHNITAAVEIENVSTEANKSEALASRSKSSKLHLDLNTRSKSKIIDIPKLDVDNLISTTPHTNRTIVEFDQLQALIQPLLCPGCNKSSLKLNSDEKCRKGLSVKLSINCETCRTVVSSNHTSGYSKENKRYSVNNSAVLSSILCGLGSYTFNKLCEHLDIPGMCKKNFLNITKLIYNKGDDIRQALELKTVDLIRRKHAEESGVSINEEDIIDIDVSYDGSWLTRGHTSHIGIGCVVDVLTGYVLDFHIVSTFCLVCQTTGRKIKEKSPSQYSEWFETHKPFCEINYTGSSAMMETHAAEVLWLRSVTKFKLRYTSMLSDGDAKSFKRVTELKPYGDIPIVKEECVNHVGKRMGSALRNLVADCSKKGTSLGGKGHGKLTQNTIKKLTLYYSRAIRKHKNVSDMQKAIMASLYHCLSTEKSPKHQLCPTGSGSWCFYNAAVAKNETPGPHSKLLCTPLNYKLLADHLKPIYKRLSEPALLQRCLLGATQNANESLHSKIWSTCDKKKFSSWNKVTFSVISSIYDFNFGFAASKIMKNILFCKNTFHAHRLGLSRQNQRLSGSAYKKSKVVMRRLQMRKDAKARRELELRDAEGPTYEAGQF
ncbi:uncharacterized protein LOC129922757 [Biomphalaria glabrata]|uniref:Uncharacterized protein LOC129922757 n=1 Tax=Biomphalaria glabrata TaxID=6526 RepID=A0A9W2YSR2_BIOGL|nr:uncharacterized protein LOC129922757 [Biomphalaria glabrata]